MAGLSEDNKLRDVFNKKVIHDLSKRLQNAYPKFQKKAFNQDALKNLNSLSYGERSQRICDALTQYLPNDFSLAAEILLHALGPEFPEPGKTDWEAFIIVPQCAFVSQNGKQHFDLSMQALYEMTKRFSAEGNLRTFLEVDDKKWFSLLKKWATDPCPHVRRLVSEGTRPRLPLAGRIKQFQDNPRPVIQLLELLKEDESEYVRRSVANNLNDISKDNPNLVIEVLKKWSRSTHQGTNWIVKHASRTLLKQGNKKVLSIFGFSTNPKIRVDLSIKKKSITIGTELEFQLEIESTSQQKQKIMIDYIVHFLKSKGTNSPKVFKWTSRELEAGQCLILNKKQHMRQTSVRKLYAGQHFLEVQINGNSYGKIEYQLRKNKRDLS